ncbi:MAG: type II secretion system F family protein [Bdellovibrionales bacterium]
MGRRRFEKKSMLLALQQVKLGYSFAESLKNTSLFPHFDYVLLANAEASGKVEEVLKQLALRYSKKYEAQQELKSQMGYPVFIFISALFLLGVPGLANGEITLQQYFMGNIATLALCAVIIYLFTKVYKEIEENPQWIKVNEVIMFHVPYLGYFLKNKNLEDYFYSLSLLIEAGIPIVEATGYVNFLSNNTIFRSATEDIKMKLMAGESIYSSFSQSGLFPEDYLPALLTAEKTGKYAECFKTISLHVGDLASQQQSRFLSLVPRLIYFGALLYIAFVLLQAQQQRLDSIRNVIGT